MRSDGFVALQWSPRMSAFWRTTGSNGSQAVGDFHPDRVRTLSQCNVCRQCNVCPVSSDRPVRMIS